MTFCTVNLILLLYAFLIHSVSGFWNMKFNPKLRLSLSRDRNLEFTDILDESSGLIGNDAGSSSNKLDKSHDDDDEFQRSKTVELEEYKEERDYYKNFYIAIGNIESEEMLSARKQAWFHHCQWLRRISLSPKSSVSIEFEYTRLSNDLMFPCGQVLGLKGNSTSDISDILTNEPLFLNGGLTGWKVFEAGLIKSQRAKYDIYDPFVFIGLYEDPKDTARFQQFVEEEYKYHLESGKLSFCSALRDPNEPLKSPILPLYDDGYIGEPLDNTDPNEAAYKSDGREKGIFLVFNCKSNFDALEYISNDLCFKNALFSQTYLSPVNLQDVDGLFHAMPRTFAQKDQLDQLHYLNPEDILREGAMNLPRLPNAEYAEENKKALLDISKSTKHYNYTRISMDDKFTTNELRTWNTDMALWQKLRTRSSQTKESGSGEEDLSNETEDPIPESVGESE